MLKISREWTANRKKSVYFVTKYVQTSITDMENKIQELTEKLLKDGVEKGNAEAERIIAEANEKAAKIMADAKAQAEEIEAAAKKNT